MKQLQKRQTLQHHHHVTCVPCRCTTRSTDHVFAPPIRFAAEPWSIVRVFKCCSNKNIVTCATQESPRHRNNNSSRFKSSWRGVTLGRNKCWHSGIKMELVWKDLTRKQLNCIPWLFANTTPRLWCHWAPCITMGMGSNGATDLPSFSGNKRRWRESPPKLRAIWAVCMPMVVM